MEDELEDEPPQLIDASNRDDADLTRLENDVKELNLVKVPITIVTGRSMHEILQDKLHNHIMIDASCTGMAHD